MHLAKGSFSLAIAAQHTRRIKGGGDLTCCGGSTTACTGGVGRSGMGGLASSRPGSCASDLTLVSAPWSKVAGLGTGAAGVALGFAPWSSATEMTLGSSPPREEDTTEGSARDSEVGITTASLINLGDGHTLPPSCVAGDTGEAPSCGCVSATATLTPAGGGDGAASIHESAERTKLTTRASEGWLCVKTGCRPE